MGLHSIYKAFKSLYNLYDLVQWSKSKNKVVLDVKGLAKNFRAIIFSRETPIQDVQPPQCYSPRASVHPTW